MRQGRAIQTASIYVLGVGATMAFGLMSPLLPDLQHAVGTSSAPIGFAYGMIFLPFLLVAGFFGSKVDTIGARTMILAGGAMILLASASNMLANRLAWLLIDNFLLGSGLVAIVVSGQTEISRSYTGRKQATALSIWAAAPFAGISIGLIVSGPVAGTIWWRAPFAVQGIIVMAAAMLCYLLWPVAERGETSVHAKPHGAIARESRVFRLAGISLLNSMMSSGGLSVWPLYLSRVHDVPIATVAGMSALTSPMSIAGAFAAAWMLSRRVGFAVVLIGTSLVCLMSGIVLYWPATPVPMVGGAMLVWAFSVGVTTALIYAMLPKLVRHETQIGAATGVLHQVGSLGGVLGAPLFFSIAGLSSPAPSFIAEIAVSWLFMLALMPMWRTADTPVPGQTKAAA
jgi:predicted MFS family arabinose efflux permease